MLGSIRNRVFHNFNKTNIRNFHASYRNLYAKETSTSKITKKDLEEIKDWEDLMKLESFDGIPTKQLEEIMKRKALKMQYKMNPDKPIKQEDSRI